MKDNFTWMKWMKWGKFLGVHKMVLDMVTEVATALVEGNKKTSWNYCWHFNPRPLDTAISVIYRYRRKTEAVNYEVKY
jgi:hypothetical protein